MRRRLLAVVAIAGCWRGQAPEPVVANHSEGGFEITSYGVGPFDASTVATEASLRTLVPGLEVHKHDLGGDSGIVFDVVSAHEKLFYVVPDDAAGYTDAESGPHRYATTVFAVFAVSPQVRVQGRPWRVGQVLSESTGLDVCECWGNHGVTACYRRHGHIRVVFEANCDRAETDGPRAMVGERIGRLMWKRVVRDLDDEPPELRAPPQP